MRREKWGKFTGEHAINPINGEELPIWETNYVEETYGTGAIRVLPHTMKETRNFANKYHIDIVERPFTDKILGEKTIHFHLRDWRISSSDDTGVRPIPMIYCEDDGRAGTEADRPVLYRTMSDFKPKPRRDSPPIMPSEIIPEGGHVAPKCGKSSRQRRKCRYNLDTYRRFFLRYPLSRASKTAKESAF